MIRGANNTPKAAKNTTQATVMSATTVGTVLRSWTITDAILVRTSLQHRRWNPDSNESRSECVAKTALQVYKIGN